MVDWSREMRCRYHNRRLLIVRRILCYVYSAKEETIPSWLETAEKQVRQVDEYLVVPHKLERIQADADARLLSDTRVKKGALRRRKRHFLAYDGSRTRDSPASSRCDSKNRSRHR